MDDIVYRPRYQRQSSGQARRKSRRNKRDRNDFARNVIKKIMRQTLICVIILAVIGAVVSIDTPVTGFLQDKVKGVLSYNVDITGIYEGIQSVVKNTESKDEVNEGMGLLEDENTDADKNISEESTSVYAQNQNDFEQNPEPVSAVFSAEESLVESVEYSSAEGEEAESEELESEESEPQNSEDEQMAFEDSGYSFLIPVGGIIGSFYGDRVHPIKKTMEFHKGIDIEAQSGTPIKAAYEGEIVEAGSETTYGNYVKIKHIDGLTSLYAHCSSLLVKKGQKVDKGDVIAEVGSTGASLGPHLHFEVRKDGKAVNPLDYISLSPN